jgi:hypothetical protein
MRLESDTERPSNVPVSAVLFWYSLKYLLTIRRIHDRLNTSPVDATEGKEEMTKYAFDFSYTVDGQKQRTTIVADYALWASHKLAAFVGRPIESLDAEMSIRIPDAKEVRRNMKQFRNVKVV